MEKIEQFLENNGKWALRTYIRLSTTVTIPFSRKKIFVFNIE